MNEELAAKQAITEVIYKYCRGLDRMDRELADTVWHPDGTADYGNFQGTGAQFLDYVLGTAPTSTGAYAYSQQHPNRGKR